MVGQAFLLEVCSIRLLSWEKKRNLEVSFFLFGTIIENHGSLLNFVLLFWKITPKENLKRLFLSLENRLPREKQHKGYCL